MQDDALALVDATLPNGAVVKVQAVTEAGGGAQDVGFADAFRFDAVQDALSGVADMVRDAVRSATPDTVEVEFGLSLAVEGGKLLGLITKAGGTAAFTVRLGWEAPAE